MGAAILWKSRRNNGAAEFRKPAWLLHLRSRRNVGNSNCVRASLRCCCRIDTGARLHPSLSSAAQQDSVWPDEFGSAFDAPFPFPSLRYPLPFPLPVFPLPLSLPTLPLPLSFPEFPLPLPFPTLPLPLPLPLPARAEPVGPRAKTSDATISRTCGAQPGMGRSSVNCGSPRRYNCR